MWMAGYTVVTFLCWLCFGLNNRNQMELIVLLIQMSGIKMLIPIGVGLAPGNQVQGWFCDTEEIAYALDSLLYENPK